MRKYTETSSRLALPVLFWASALSLCGCVLFEPETDFECFKPDCSPVDSGTAGTGAAENDAAQDADAAGTSGRDSSAGTGATDATTACPQCDEDQVCEELSGECVQCLENDDCESPTPVCTVDHRCVPCTLDHHCPSTAPACTNDNTCVGCTDSTRQCGGDTPHCDETRNECVQCLESTDCTDPAASRCNDGTCQPCTGPRHCDHIDGLGVCDVSSGNGECVECTGTQYAACAMSSGGSPYACDSMRRACTEQEVGSAAPCEACISDAHCATGLACMETKFGTANTGYYCLWREAATGTGAPNGNCGNVRPYIGTESGWTSIDGQAATVCKPSVTTCQAQSDFRAKSCSGPTPDGHAECGAGGVADAYCAPFLAGDFCTTPCASFLDCKETRPGDDMECQSSNLGGEFIQVCAFE